jgi:hypothetical protein
MSNMEPISERLFAKIRGRFPSVTIGDVTGTVTDDPRQARYFDFDYTEGTKVLGKVSVSLDERGVVVLYNTDIMAEADESEKNAWYDFLKEIRFFAKKNMLNFDTRDITKSNLDKRDYAHLTRTAGDKQMSESKLYGTARTSYEDIDNARLVLKHTQPINQELPAGRTQHVHSIYIESADGERYKYPFRHLNGARALARHVSNGGNLYDDFGQHIVNMSEELNKLRQFRTYMNRSAVMAEGLSGYLDIVSERVETIKDEIQKLQRQNYYTEASKDFKPAVKEEVPEDLQNAWIDELTIRTFNEELKSVFPYIYGLVQERTKIKEMGPDELLGEFDGPDETKVDDKDNMGFSDKEIKMAYGVLNDPRYKGGNYSGAVATIEKIAKGLSDHPGVKKALQKTNETPEADFERAMDLIVSEEDDSLFAGDEAKSAEALKKLNGLMAQHFPAGVNGTNAIQSLKGIIDDPMLLDMFKKVGQKDADQCVRPLVMKYIKGKAPEMISKIDTGDMEEVPAEAYTPTKDKEDYEAKKKAIQDLQMDPNTSKDPELKKELVKRKAALDKDAPKEGTKKPGEKLEELVKSYYDYTTNAFPKGETAVITACQKEFGEKSVPFAEKMIHRLLAGKDNEMERVKKLAGL